VQTGGPLVVIYAVDLETMEQRVKQAGGKIVRPIFSFPGGRRFHFADPSGYELAVWSDK
jgi:predicted enzyme related to lactoylglutathione lyase